jgi:hypothetical protein
VLAAVRTGVIDATTSKGRCPAVGHAEHNPSLAPLGFLLGEWEVELSNTSFLSTRDDTALGQLTGAWIEDGALLVLRQGESGAPPEARWTISRDESADEYTVLYHDARGVSRVYAMTYREDVWRMWRVAPGLSQRFEGRVNSVRTVITATWQRSSDGSIWDHDFDVTYTRRR